MNYGRAFGAGALGGLVMTILMALGRMMGMTEMNLEMALGSMMTQNISSATWVMGFIMHLVISGLIALIYAAGFEYVTHRSNWLLGAGFGAIHTIIAGIVMGMMGGIHPLMAPPPAPEGYLMAPGFFASNFGPMTVMAFIVLHLIYGAIVGAMYRVTAEHLHHHPGVPTPA
ncbi:MAG: DUF6789 family protein [Blastocatellales bacterium]